MADPVTITKAAEDIKKLAARFQPILDLAAVLEQVGSIDQAGRDAQTRTDKAREGERDANESEAQAKARLTEAEGRVTECNAEAGRIVVRAQESAEHILVKARADAATIDQESADEKTKLKQELVKANREVREVEGVLSVRKDELVTIEKKIADLRRSVSSLQ